MFLEIFYGYGGASVADPGSRIQIFFHSWSQNNKEGEKTSYLTIFVKKISQNWKVFNFLKQAQKKAEPFAKKFKYFLP